MYGIDNSVAFDIVFRATFRISRNNGFPTNFYHSHSVWGKTRNLHNFGFRTPGGNLKVNFRARKIESLNDFIAPLQSYFRLQASNMPRLDNKERGRSIYFQRVAFLLAPHRLRLRRNLPGKIRSKGDCLERKAKLGANVCAFQVPRNRQRPFFCAGLSSCSEKEFPPPPE